MFMRRQVIVGIMAFATLGLAMAEDAQVNLQGKGNGQMEKNFPMIRPVLENVNASNIELNGRWKRELDVIATGWIERIVKSEHPVYYGMYWNKTWSKADEADIWAAHYSAYVSSGLVKIARLAPNSYVGEKYRKEWLPKLLASQNADGYIGGGQVDGCFSKKADMKTDFKTPIPSCEALNVGLTLELLLWEYEFSKDEKVLQSALRFADFITGKYLADKEGFSTCTQYQLSGDWGVMISALGTSYDYSQKTSVKEKVEAFFAKHELETSGMGKPQVAGHNVGLCSKLRGVAEMYPNAGRADCLELATGAFDKIMAFNMQATGIFAAHEDLKAKGPRNFSEHCGVVGWIEACILLAKITGQVKFADAAERSFHNAYFGSKSPDGVTLAYAHAPNQLFATKWEGSMDNRGGDDDNHFDIGRGRSYYSMDHSPRCCNTITTRLFPEYIENSVCKTQDNGLAVMFYGPAKTTVDLQDKGPIVLLQDTDYPFEDVVRMTLAMEKPANFPLHLRIPGWCKTAIVDVNGEKIDISGQKGKFAKLGRNWKNGDKVVVTLTPEISLDRYDKGNSWDVLGRQKGMAVMRGPLCFALPVKEKWEYIGESRQSPENLKEAWSLTPVKDALWNVAIELDAKDPEKSMKLVALAPKAKALPWSGEAAPIGLRVWGRQLPDWEMDRIGGNPHTPALPGTIGKTGERQQFTLVPFMFTRLRMTYLPILER